MPSVAAYPTAFSITTSDTVDLPNATTGGIYVGANGDVKVKTLGGNVVTFAAVVAGTYLPVVVSRVYATGTTSTSVIGLAV